MDLGSIEDLLRPASLKERKQKLGLLADTPSPGSKNLAAAKNVDSRPSVRDKPIVQHNNHHLSPKHNGRPLSSRERRDRSPGKSPKSPSRNTHKKKRRRMENRPPLAPKPDGLKDQPSPVHSPARSAASSPSQGGAPVPKPRRKPGGPPPAKPMPYRKHVELKDREVSTFKSDNPVAPPRVRQRPPLPTKPSTPPTYRLSIPGEPSEYFQIRNESSTAPVNYAIPVVPKRTKPSLTAPIDARPRLDTPMVLPDPDDVIVAGGNTTTQADIPTSRANVNGGVVGVVNGISSPNPPPGGADGMEMYADAYAEVEEEEEDEEAYAVVSPTRKAMVMPSKPVSPLPRTTSALPPLTSSGPVPARRSKSPTPPREVHSQRSPSPAQATPTTQTSLNPGIDDHEYNITSHVKEAARKNLVAPPIPPPTKPSQKPSRVQKSVAAESSVTAQEYSVLDRSERKAKPRPSPAQNSVALETSTTTDEYSVLDRSERKAKPRPPSAQDSLEYSVLRDGRGDHVISPSGRVTSPISHVTPEGYGHLDMQAVGASSEISADSTLYEELRSDSPVNRRSNDKEKNTPPPVPPPMEKHPRALARKASDKFKSEGPETTVLSSRDRSKLPAYRSKDEPAGGEVGASPRLPARTRPPPPVPHPKRQKKMESNEASTSSTNGAPDLADNLEGGGRGVVSVDVPTGVLEEAGYETVNTFSPPPEEMETDDKANERLKPKPPPQAPPRRKRKVSPAPSPKKARGTKPPPLPKPKQIATPTTPSKSRTAQLSSEVPVKKEMSLENHGYEPVIVLDEPNAVTETVDGSHDVSHDISKAPLPPSSSPSFDLGIDQILQDKMADASSGGQEAADGDENLDGEGELARRKEMRKTSRSSGYENQAVIDSVERGGHDVRANVGGEGGEIERTDGGDSWAESRHDHDEDGSVKPMEVGVAIDHHDNNNDDEEPTCTVLSPSELFTVPQHAVPGRFDYCEIDVELPEAPSPRQVEIVPNHGDSAEGTSGTFTVLPHSYPDPQGYCDIEIQEAPPTSHSPNVQRVSMTSTNSSGRMSTGSANSGTVPAVGVATDDVMMDARGYCDIDIPPREHSSPSPQFGGHESVPPQVINSDNRSPTPSGNDVVTDAQGYCDIDIKTPPTCSHEYESVPETVTRRKPPGKAPPPPVGRPAPRRKSQDDVISVDTEAKPSGGTTPTNKAPPTKRPPPRRRAPPPPPVKAKTVEDSLEKSPHSSPLENELVISTGLATMPRSPRKQPPKPPPPFASSSSPLLSRKQMSPLPGKKLDLMASPQTSVSPLPSPAAPLNSPKGWGDANESSPQSSGLKKKFKGLFKKQSSNNSSSGAGGDGGASNSGGVSSSTSSGPFTRRPSWKRKKGNKPLSEGGGGGGGDLSPKVKAKSLPGHTRQACGSASQPLHFQISYDADQEEDDDDIYSTIKEDKIKPTGVAAPVLPAAMAVVPVSHGGDQGHMEGNEEDDGGYNVVDKKPRSISVSVSKKKKKSGKKGLDMRKASSVEHLYESADFDGNHTAAAVPVSKSVDNSPQVPRRPLENGDHAPVPLASPALPQPNRNVLAGPPNLDELKPGIDSSHLYAQVVAPPTPTQNRKSDDLSEKKADELSAVDQTGETGKTGTEESVSTGLTVGDGGDRKGGLLAVAAVNKPSDTSSPEHAAEIEHIMEGDDAYAVVPVKMKKEAKKRKAKEKKGECPVAELSIPTNGSSKSAGNVGRSNSKAAPPKPPKSYREHIASVTTPTQVTVSEAEGQGSAENEGESENLSKIPASDSLGNLSPLFPSLEFSFGLTPQERTRVASFSSGPPSFPPPPPPMPVTPEPDSEKLAEEQAEGLYSTVDETKKAKRKAPPPPSVKRPPPPRANAQNGALGEEELGYEVVKNDKKTPGRKKDAPGSQKSKPAGLVHIDKVNKPHLSPNLRAQHVYTTLQDVETENGAVKTKEGYETMPVRTPGAGYATTGTQGRRGSLPSSGGKGSRSPSLLGKLAKHPKLSPKTRPPPPPPGQRRGGVGGGDSGEQLGKKMFVSMENSPTPDSAGAEPKFLFSHAQKFIVVGDADNSPPVSNVYEDESDGDLLDSTDWETSSGEEDAEEERNPSPEPKEARPKTFYIAREILTTERTFVKGLTLIDKDFRQSMRSANNAHEKPVITDEGLKMILGNVSSLLSLNSGLLQELEERMAEWSTNACIGDIILKRAPYLKLYTEYISRFDKALKTLEEFTKKSPVFAQVLREFESQPKCANIPLAGYMLDIVQRITRYKLLLSDYVKHLPDDSPDKDPSQKALVIISSVATHVNETVRQMDNFRKVCDVRKRLIGDSGDTLITPHRKLLKEGELMKFSRKEKQPRMFFLFNDILIYASSIPPANTTYKVIKRIPLDGMRVERLDDPEMRYGFQIISTCKSFRLEASNREELKQWMTAFESAIKENTDRKKTAEQTDDSEETDSSPSLGNLAPPWLPDSAVSMCQLCSTHFTVTRRRHHCRACGKIFCSECSCYLAPLKYKNNKLGRVCQICYEKLPKSDDTAVSTKRTSLQRGSKSRVSLPSVLREVKARDQSAQVSGYLLTRNAKSRKWKKRWFVVFNLVLYEFERHEDVSAKRSITLPSYQVVKHDSDPLVFVLDHPGTGKEYFKEDSPEQLERWIEVLQKAVLGEIDEEEEPADERRKCDLEEVDEEEEEEEETADESSPSHQAPPIDTPSDTPSDATQSPSKETSLEQRPLSIEDDVTSSS